MLPLMLLAPLLLLLLLPLVSSNVPLQQRLQQLDLLLQVNQQLSGKLSRASNNNGSTPLMVAASGIRTADHATVFRRLLQSADFAVLATPTNSGEDTGVVDESPRQLNCAGSSSKLLITVCAACQSVTTSQSG